MRTRLVFHTGREVTGFALDQPVCRQKLVYLHCLASDVLIRVDSVVVQQTSQIRVTRCSPGSLPVDQLDLEFANSHFANLEIFRSPKFTKKVAVGVIDVHSHILETKSQVKEGIRRALTVFAPEQIMIDPDCGLKTRTVPEAIDKLKVMVEATQQVKHELGIS